MYWILTFIAAVALPAFGDEIGLGLKRNIYEKCQQQIIFSSFAYDSARDNSFEKSVGKLPYSSWASRFPKLYAEILEIRDDFPSYEHAFLDGISMGGTMERVLEKIRTRNNDTIKQVQDAVARFGYTLKANDRMQMAFKSLSLAVNDLCRNGSIAPGRDWRQNIHWEKYQAMVTKWKGVPFTAEKERFKDMLTLGARLRSFWGELRAAFVLPHTYAASVTFENFARLLHSPLDDETFPRHLARKELDIVAPVVESAQSAHRSREWIGIEVKTLLDVMSVVPEAEPYFEKWEASLLDLKEAAALGGFKMQFHIALTTGYTPEAKERLLKMGFAKVIGPMVDPGTR